MKSSVASLGPSARKIVARIKKVRRAAEKAARSKRRFAHYRYLRAVLSAYRFFEENDLLHHLVEIAPSVLKTSVRKKWHPLRVVLEATCDSPDYKVRSKWTRALEYAVAEKVDPKDLTQFIRAHGGIAGCADLASKTKPRRKQPDNSDPRYARSIGAIGLAFS